MYFISFWVYIFIYIIPLNLQKKRYVVLSIKVGCWPAPRKPKKLPNFFKRLSCGIDPCLLGKL
jgi:hypothetical protein